MIKHLTVDLILIWLNSSEIYLFILFILCGPWRCSADSFSTEIYCVGGSQKNNKNVLIRFCAGSSFGWLSASAKKSILKKCRCARGFVRVNPLDLAQTTVARYTLRYPQPPHPSVICEFLCKNIYYREVGGRRPCHGSHISYIASMCVCVCAIILSLYLSGYLADGQRIN